MRFISLTGSLKQAGSFVSAVVCVVVFAMTVMSVTVGFGGCVAEDLAACPPALRLTFRYTLNTSRKDLLSESVRTARVYVFDYSTGVLTDMIEIPPEDLARGRHDEPHMPEGLYTMVAWGVSGEEPARSYSARQMPDESTHDNTEVEIGTTTIDDFHMMLGIERAPSDKEGDVVPVPADFDDLFWAIADGVEIVEGESRRVDLDFLRNTSLLRIAVTGLEHFEDPDTVTPTSVLPLRLFATGSNGRYRYDDAIDPHARTVHYTSFDHRRTGGGMSLNIPMQRLHIRRHEDDPVLLHIESLAGAIPGIPPIDLVSAITESNDGMGNYPYKTQESIDREHEFRIALAISPDPDNPGSYLLTMTINEWNVIIIRPIIDKPQAL